MGKHRTPYPAEFRAQMVELVKAGRRPEELEKGKRSIRHTRLLTVGNGQASSSVTPETLGSARCRGARNRMPEEALRPGQPLSVATCCWRA